MNAFERTILRSMNLPISSNENIVIDSNLASLSKNTVFQRYFNIDLRGPEVEVPVFTRREVQTFLVDNDYHKKCKQDSNIIEWLIVPLYIGSKQEKRTSNSMIRAMFETSTRIKLTKIKTYAGLIYYGGAGIIFNSNMDCLFLSTVKYNIENGVNIMKSVAYISPKVFIDKGPVEKNIIKNVIPLLLEKKVTLTQQAGVKNYFNYSDGGNQDFKEAVPDIIISDISDRFISKPDMPDPELFDEEKLNSFILDSYEAKTLEVRL